MDEFGKWLKKRATSENEEKSKLEVDGKSVDLKEWEKDKKKEWLDKAQTREGNITKTKLQGEITKDN